MTKKIKVKVSYTVCLMTVGFDEVSRAYRSEGEYGQPIGTGGIIEIEVEIPDKIGDRLDKDHFIQIEVGGELDYITEDATDDVKFVAYLRKTR